MKKSLPRLPRVDSWRIDDTVKGYPGGEAPLALADIGRQHWNVLRQDLPFPVAVLKESALANNRAWMQQFLANAGVVLCPHGKTTMSPQLFQAQLDDGAWGITCATVSQLQVYRRHGIRRVLIANQVVGRRNLAYLLDEFANDPQFEPYVLVDSPAAVQLLADAARARSPGRPLRVLLEVGQGGVRTGARDAVQVGAIVEAIVATMPALALHGVECFEGTIAGPRAEVVQRLDALLTFAIDSARVVAGSRAASRADPFLLTAGGSEFFDIVTDRLRRADIGRPTQVILRSGCYLTQDHLHYARAFERITVRSLQPAQPGATLRPALEVWACVQSRPEPGRVYVTGGKRDLSFDMDLPTPVAWYRPGAHEKPHALSSDHHASAINDQHLHLTVPSDSPLAVGDLVALGISHPCTTFDKWQLIYVVADDYTVVDAIRTFF